VNNSRDLIRQVGRALYGARWQLELSRELGVNRITVQRWNRGDMEPSPGVWIELRALVHGRIGKAHGALTALDRRISRD